MTAASQVTDPSTRRPASRAARRAAIIWVLVSLTASVVTALFAVAGIWTVAVATGVGAFGLSVGGIHAIHRLVIVEHARRR